MSRRWTIPGRSASPQPSSGSLCELGVRRQQAAHERARAVGSVRMHDEARRLVDDDHRLVLIDDPEGDLARSG